MMAILSGEEEEEGVVVVVVVEVAISEPLGCLNIWLVMIVDGII
jgi:hypothetical protein